MFTPIVITIFSLIVLIFSVMIHELAHGYVAFSLGDPTAKYEGRLTLNPLKHIDPFGSVILPLLLLLSGSPILIGWAKPVPINPYNFKDQKWGTLKVAISGPATNFGIAIILGLVIRFLNFLPVETGLQLAPFIQLMGIVVFYNIFIGLFNLVPIPPLDGSWVLFKFLPDSRNKIKIFLQQYGMFILIFLIFFGGSQFLVQLSELTFRMISGL